MATTTGLLDLPVELLLETFSYLDVSSFLNLTSTSKALHKPEFVNDSAYWSNLVRTSFRVPNQPVVEKDGERWQKLYKRMLTQSRIYTWGNNEKACLGHSWGAASQLVRMQDGRMLTARRRPRISWPEQMQRVDDLGVISDLQCGGWSTTLLTAKGALYTAGVIDGLQIIRQHAPHVQKVMEEPMPLRYPPGFPHPYDRYDASTAVKQFSAGRAHILALSDCGRIWSWQNIEHAAFHVKFLNHDFFEDGRTKGKRVKKVVAGWNKSAALIEGTGIVLWEPLQRDEGDTELEDAALVLESVVVPKTGFQESSTTIHGQRQQSRGEDHDVGEVRSFVVLEEIVLFSTHLGKVFASQIFWSNREQRIGEPFELPLPPTSNNDDVFVTDVQGSYKSFGVFTKSGAVLTSNQDRVMDLLQSQPGEISLFTCIPALQNRQVIQLSFGDYHFHALHSPGYITSYGTEPQNCGALGLGGPGAEGCLRGMRYRAPGGDASLVSHAYSGEGRRVWFERGKRAWVKFLTSGGVDPEEAKERLRLAIGSPNPRCQGEVSEWIEQQGRDWETKFGVRGEDDDGLGGYFAMSVTAAGWHSGALVLVNEEMVEKLKKAYEIPDPVENSIAEDLQANGAAKVAQATEDESALSSATSLTSLATSAITTTADYGRWLLGFPPYNTTSAPDYIGAPVATGGPQTGPLTGQNANANMNDFRRGTHPINYGAKPRVGVTYAWAKDHFPRLVLSDGTEMPGEVEFDQWRFGRPVWDLEFTL